MCNLKVLNRTAWWSNQVLIIFPVWTGESGRKRDKWDVSELGDGCICRGMDFSGEICDMTI